MIQAIKSRFCLPLSLSLLHLCSCFNFVSLIAVFDLVYCLLLVVNSCVLLYLIMLLFYFILSLSLVFFFLLVLGLI